MKILNKVTFFLLVLFFAITIPNAGFASSLAVSVACFDTETGGGLTPRVYACGAFPSGGTPPYTFTWQDYDPGLQFVFGSYMGSASYHALRCNSPIIAGAIVVVEDNAGSIEIGSTTVQLNCP